MLAWSTYYIISRTGVVFGQMCFCTELTGSSRASVSYMAKFLTACTLRSRRDLQVFNYLYSYLCNQDFLLPKDFLSFFLIFYSKDYRAKSSLWIMSFILDKIHLGSFCIPIGLKISISSFRSLEPPSPKKGKVGMPWATI